MPDKEFLAELTADVVASYVKNNQVSVAQLPDLIKQVHQTFASLGQSQGDVEKQNLSPMVSIEDSVSDEHLVCLEDGLEFRSLKRHLKASHGMTPEQYREKWDLPANYPMVAQNYSLKRSKLAKQSGLGRVESTD